MGFIMIPDWAARGVLHPREFAVYAALLSRADAVTRECYPSYETLSAEAGVTRRQVPYALAELIDEHLLRARRSRSVNRYTVLRFPDARPDGYRSRFERGERLAQRSRVREPHSVDGEQHDTVREPHSAEGGSRTSQSAGDALEPNPVEPAPVEPLRKRTASGARRPTKRQMTFIADLRSMLTLDDEQPQTFADAHAFIGEHWQEMQRRAHNAEGIDCSAGDLSPEARRYAREHGLLLDEGVTV